MDETRRRSTTIRRVWVWTISTLALVFALWGGEIAQVEARTEPDDIAVREVEADHLRFHYPERYEGAVDELEESARRSMYEVIGMLGIEEMPTVEVWVLPELNEYFRLTGQEGRAPDWAVGLSLTGRHTVLLLNGLGANREPVDLEKTFAHELAHVGMDVARGGHHVPRWFNEGVAVIVADEWTLERGELVGRRAAQGKLIPFRYLKTSYPPHSSKVSLAYAQSAHFIKYLRGRFGKQVVRRILGEVRGGTRFSEAFEVATGEALSDVESDWSHEISGGSSIGSQFADGMPFFFGAALLFLVAWGVTRRRSAEKLARMEDEDSDGWDYDPSQYPLPGQQRE